MATSYISKTAFLKFEQCQKAFFLYKNHYYLRDKLSTDKQLTFKRGHDIGALAQQLFPGGINVVETDQNKERAIEYTKQLIENKTEVIYEATFVHNSILVMVDILVNTPNGYMAYEVKCSIKVSETYIKDACLQYHVIKNSLPWLADFFIVTLNDTYVFDGTLDLKKLFKRRSILKDAIRNEEYIREQIKNAQLIIEQNVIPNVNVGKHCFSPYECDFFGTCWKDKIGEDSIFTLGKINKDDLFEWHYKGINTIAQIPNVKSLAPHLQIQIESNRDKEVYRNRKGISDVLSKIKAPYAAIDMEIWGQPVPEIIGTRPFQKIPFLYTLYNAQHEADFFFDHVNDDRRAFAESLIQNTKAFASLLVYDKSLENLVINELAVLFPELKDALYEVSSKLIDVSEIIQHQYYYHFLFKGNYSLKAVSKVVLDEDVFEKENIFTGLEAMNAFVGFRNQDNPIEKQTIKDDLITYCMADSKATFLLCEKFTEML